MLLDYYWILLFSSFFGGTIDPSEMKTQQPAPVIQNKQAEPHNPCSPFPECKLDPSKNLSTKS
jgi:hypothetical protein